MSREKEPGFFVPELWGNRSPGDYAALFFGADGCVYAGESSTHYAKLPRYKGVSERIYHYNPDSRIIYVVRDPYERTMSQYFHALRSLSMDTETRPILKALQAEQTYWAYSDYAMQIRPYGERFGWDQVYIMLFDDLVSQPEASLADLCAWLGLETVDLAREAIEANAAPQSFVRARGNGILNRVRYSRAWSALSPFVPKAAKRVANAAAEQKVDKMLTDEDRQEVIKLLRPEFEKYISALEELMERDLSRWRK